MADAGEVVALIRGADVDGPGGHFIDVAELLMDWSRPSFRLATDAVGVVDRTGLLVGFAELSRPQRAGAVVAPAHRGRGIGSMLLSWIEQRSAAVGSEVVGQTVPVPDVGAAQLLAGRGYVPRWRSWLLELGSEAELDAATLPVGWAIRPCQPGREEQAAHRVVEDAFAEWPDRPPVSYADWSAFTLGGSAHAPWHLQVMVADDGALVGVAALSVSEQGEGWIEQLAVAREHRGRGFGRALLTAGFAAVRAHGARKSLLATDSRTGALDLYLHLGMRVVAESVQLARNPRAILSVAEFRRLVDMDHQPDWWDRARLCTADLAVWKEIIADPGLRDAAVLNKTLPPEILHALAADPDWRIRYAVAEKHRATPEILRSLADDPSESVRHLVAGHRNTPFDVVERLSTDSWDEIRSTARDNLDRRR